MFIILDRSIFPNRLKEECEEESNQLQEKKIPLLHEKDEIVKQILRAEDLLKRAISDVNRILSSCCDQTLSELQRQVSNQTILNYVEFQLRCCDFYQKHTVFVASLSFIFHLPRLMAKKEKCTGLLKNMTNIWST